MIENIKHYPRYERFFNDITTHWNIFRTDALRVMNGNMTVRWHESALHNDKWDVFGLIWQNEICELTHYCPNSFEIVNRHRDVVVNCGFSIMHPKCEIYPHHGYTGEVLRCHLGLVVPEGDCCLKVEDEVRHWSEGEVLLFDDTKLHSTWNKTDQMRVILLTDLRK